MKSRDENLIKVAIYYYEEKKTQTEIAKELGISRPTVSKMLNEAIEKNIVKITVHPHLYDNHKLRQEILDKYALESVIVVNSTGSSNATKSEIGQACAYFVEEKLSDLRTLGIGWGTTVYEFVNAAHYLNCPQLSIIPLMGGVSLSEVAHHSNHLAVTLAQKYRAQSHLLYAPAIAETIEVKNALVNSHVVQSILSKGRNVDLAIIGVGNPMESLTYRDMGYITKKEEKSIIEEQAIGDILATFYNKEGNTVETSLSQRMIGHDLKDVRRMKEVVILANGEEKAISIKALLNLEIIDHLIIDTEIAKALV